MTSAPETLTADLVWTGERFEQQIVIEIADGFITRVAPGVHPTTRALTGHALLPGFVNAHSHAFQRGLRGSGETFPTGTGSFWTWREAMYDLVARLDPETAYDLSRLAFDEMLDVGITTVGEFHYVHHDRPDDFALDDVILRAAADAGIRIVLLNAFYRTGGFGRTLEPAQTRFATPSVDAYWRQMDALAQRITATSQSLGVVAHSLRAVPLDDLRALYREARDRDYVLHLHLEEQRREVEECRAALNRTPMTALLDTLGTAERVTAVHCTHSETGDLTRFLEAGGRICVCPLTEANLGDGIPSLATLASLDGKVSLGTDSNARIDMFDEVRWLEYGQRLREERRGVLTNRTGEAAPRLLDCATRGGATALGIPAGHISPGGYADFVAIDLDARPLRGATPETLPAALLTGADPTVVANVCVGGCWRGPV